MARISELCHIGGPKHLACTGRTGVAGSQFDAECECQCHEDKRKMDRLLHMFTLGAVMEDKAKRQEPEAKPKQKKFWYGSAPVYCEICGRKLTTTFVDGATQYGPWAKMCPTCHLTVGRGLGLGRGQKYNVKTLEKLEG